MSMSAIFLRFSATSMTSYENDDWTGAGNIYIRKVSLYDSLNLPLNEKAKYAISSYGGPIAIAAISNLSTNTWKIFVHKSNGVRIAEISAEDLFFLSWTKDQKIFVMNSEGRVYVHNLLGDQLEKFNIGDVFLVKEAKMFVLGEDNGLVIMNKCNEISGISSIKSRALWNVRGKDDSWGKLKITCWTPIPRVGEPTGVLVCSCTSIFCGSSTSKFSPRNCEWAHKRGAYTSSTPNADCSLIALMHDSHSVQIVGATLDVLIHVVQLSAATPVRWCGNDFIFIQKSPNELEFGVVKSGDKIDVDFPQPAYVGVDGDSLRVFTASKYYLVDAVPESMIEALGCLSRGATALLYDACKKMNNLENPSYDSYLYIKMIGDSIRQAIANCLDAAANHTNLATQTKLLQAANMGMAFCEYDRADFVEVQRILRVLNTLRHFGFPITHSQIRELGINGLIDRLTMLHEWSLPIELCKVMEVRDDVGVYVVLGKWCRWVIGKFKAQVEKSDEFLIEYGENALAKKIISHLTAYPHVNYADIAEFAARKDLRVLAYDLLEHEADFSRRIGILLRLKNNKKALEVALQSQHPDLLHMVLDHICKNGVTLSAEVETLIEKNPQAYSLYQSRISESAPDKVVDLYKQSGDFMRQIIHHLRLAEEMSSDYDTSRMVEELQQASGAMSRDGALTQLVEQCIQLIADNNKLEERYACVMTNKSLRETFIFVTSKGEMALAESLRKIHKLSDRQYWMWITNGLALGGRWNQLEQFCRTKKSPIGYVPLVETCCRHGNASFALCFWDKIVHYEDQIRAKTLMKDFVGAARLAVARDDMSTLQTLRGQQIHGSETWKAINSLMQSVKT